MYHRARWTPKKIKQRLELIAPVENDSIQLNLGPYQIITIRLKGKA